MAALLDPVFPVEEQGALIADPYKRPDHSRLVPSIPARSTITGICRYLYSCSAILDDKFSKYVDVLVKIYYIKKNLYYPIDVY